MAFKYTRKAQGTRELMNSADIQRGMVRAAEVVCKAARDLPTPPKVGSHRARREYQEAFRVEPNTVKKVKGARGAAPRGAALVINDHELERLFGARNRTLYRALDALKGVRLE